MRALGFVRSSISPKVTQFVGDETGFQPVLIDSKSRQYFLVTKAIQACYRVKDQRSLRAHLSKRYCDREEGLFSL